MRSIPFLRLLAPCALVAMLLAAGCAAPMHQAAYEYRYRVFEAGQPLPSTMEQTLVDQVVLRSFNTPAELNASIDELTKEGFVLEKVEQVRDTPYYVFVFQRELPLGFRQTRAPAEFAGSFRPDNQMFSGIQYTFTPVYQGYKVSILRPGLDPQVVDAVWTGSALVAEKDRTQHTFLLGGTGSAVTHVEETLGAPGAMSRQVFTLVPVAN